MPSRYPNGKDRKLYIQVLSSVEEVRAVDKQAGITGFHITFQAMRAGVITWDEHTVKEGSQSRAPGKNHSWRWCTGAQAKDTKGKQPVSKDELQKIRS